MGEKRHRYEDFALTALRIAAGLAFFSHGLQKTFGVLGGFGPDGVAAPLITRFGAAGVIEIVCGLAITLGLLTRPFAFFASGQMAIAYFWVHASGSDALFWWGNGGELAMLYCFVWLFFAARGAGPFSIDAGLQKRVGGG